MKSLIVAVTLFLAPLAPIADQVVPTTTGTASVAGTVVTDEERALVARGEVDLPVGAAQRQLLDALEHVR